MLSVFLWILPFLENPLSKATSAIAPRLQLPRLPRVTKPPPGNRNGCKGFMSLTGLQAAGSQGRSLRAAAPWLPLTMQRSPQQPPGWSETKEGRTGRTGRERGGRGDIKPILLSPRLTWPHSGLPELFVDEVHLVQATLNLLDAVGRRQDPGDGRIKQHRVEGAGGDGTAVGGGRSCLPAEGPSVS